MHTHPVSIWGAFADVAMAGRAVTRLEQMGFSRSQIAVNKHFERALTQFDWARTFYVRLPEGIVTGFTGGAIAAILLSFVAERGIPSPLTFAAMVFFGTIGGAILGGLGGVAYALMEPMLGPGREEESVEIGVQCFDFEAEVQAKELLTEMGAVPMDSGAA